VLHHFSVKFNVPMVNAASMDDSRAKQIPSLLGESDGVRNDARFEVAASIRDE
jgi:hypothetical protein